MRSNRHFLVSSAGVAVVWSWLGLLVMGLSCGRGLWVWVLRYGQRAAGFKWTEFGLIWPILVVFGADRLQVFRACGLLVFSA